MFNKCKCGRIKAPKCKLCKKCKMREKFNKHKKLELIEVNQ